MKPPYERELTAEELARRSPEDIDLSDLPELGDEFFKNARLLGPHERKRQMTIRIDGDVIDWFKAQGSGYQSRMNAVLRAYVESQR
jgi:uncharacterized protein (DUF4415 family)